MFNQKGCPASGGERGGPQLHITECIASSHTERGSGVYRSGVYTILDLCHFKIVVRLNYGCVLSRILLGISNILPQGLGKGTRHVTVMHSSQVGYGIIPEGEEGEGAEFLWSLLVMVIMLDKWHLALAQALAVKSKCCISASCTMDTPVSNN